MASDPPRRDERLAKGKNEVSRRKRQPLAGRAVSSPAMSAVSAIESNPSTNWGIESKRFFNCADALTAGVIQV